jgi:glutaminase
MRATVVSVKASTLASVYVGSGADAFGRRLSGARWGNPFSHLSEPEHELARRYFVHLRCHPEVVERARTELAGKQLACGCAGPCHGLILAALANGRELEEIEHEWREAGLLAEQQELFA